MLLFLSISFLLLLGTLLPKEKQNVYLLISFIVLFILSAFRDVSVGTDTYNYETTFNNLENGIYWVKEHIEPGWVFLNELTLYFGLGFQSLLFLVSFITLAFVFTVAVKNSPNPMLTIFLYYNLYFYFLSFNISRQMLAASIICFSFFYLLRKQYLVFISFVLLSSLFHISSLVAILFVFWDFINLKKINYIFLIILSFFIGLFGYDFIYLILDRFVVEDFSYIRDENSGNILGNALYLILFNSFIFALMMPFRKIDNYFKHILLFAIIMNLIIRVPFGVRLLIYFSIYQIIFYPYFIELLKGREVKIFYLSLILLFSYFILLYNFGYGGILPYSNSIF